MLSVVFKKSKAKLNLAKLIYLFISVQQGHQSTKECKETIQAAYEYFRNHRIKGFFSLLDNMGLQQGTSALLQVAGLGKMKPNILLLGYKNDCKSARNTFLTNISQQYSEYSTN